MIGPVTPLRDQAFQPHVAGRPEQVRPDLALLKRSDEDAVGRTREEARRSLRRRLARPSALDAQDQPRAAHPPRGRYHDRPPERSTVSSRA